MKWGEIAVLVMISAMIAFPIASINLERFIIENGPRRKILSVSHWTFILWPGAIIMAFQVYDMGIKVCRKRKLPHPVSLKVMHCCVAIVAMGMLVGLVFGLAELRQKN